MLPGMLSAFSKNHCPDCAGISVRIKQESVSVFSKNAVRNQQESLSGLGKNMHNTLIICMLCLTDDKMSFKSENELGLLSNLRLKKEVFRGAL